MRKGSTAWLALRGPVQASGIAHTRKDGLSVASLGLAPDGGISLTQHFGMSVRHLDAVPLGGAAAGVSLRRAAAPAGGSAAAGRARPPCSRRGLDKIFMR